LYETVNPHNVYLNATLNTTWIKIEFVKIVLNNVQAALEIVPIIAIPASLVIIFKIIIVTPHVTQNIFIKMK
jgi:hypothetical protein